MPPPTSGQRRSPLPARGCNWGCKCRVKKGKSSSRSRRGGVTPRGRGCKVTPPLHPPALGYAPTTTTSCKSQKVESRAVALSLSLVALSLSRSPHHWHLMHDFRDNSCCSMVICEASLEEAVAGRLDNSSFWGIRPEKKFAGGAPGASAAFAHWLRPHDFRDYCCWYALAQACSKSSKGASSPSDHPVAVDFWNIAQ